MAIDIFGIKARRDAEIAKTKADALESQLQSMEAKSVSFITGADETTGNGNLLYLTNNRRHADNNSVVMACTLWAIRNIKHALPRVVKETSDGYETIPNHPCAAVIKNPQGKMPRSERTRMTGSRMAGVIVHQLLFDGNCYQYKLRNASGAVVGLQYLPYHAVTVVERQDMAGVVAYYELNLMNSSVVKVSPDDIVHHQIGVDPRCPVKGISPLKSVMRQVLTDNEIAVYSHSIVKMPTPGLIVSPKMGRDQWATMTVDEADDLAEIISQKTSGEKAGGVVVPTMPMEIAHMRLSPDQMAIDKLNSLPEERITAVFGIPAIVAGLGAGLNRSTFSNMAEAREAATEEFLIPMWEDMSDTYTSDLLEDFGKVDSQMVDYDLTRVRSLMVDEDLKHDRARKDFQANIINLAEARTEIGQAPMPGDENTWSYMRTGSPMAPQGSPQAPNAGKTVRMKAEQK